MAELLKSLLAPRTWKVVCPACHGRPTEVDGCWSSTSVPRVIWTCSTCNGEGAVSVEHAKGATDATQ